MPTVLAPRSQFGLPQWLLGLPFYAAQPSNLPTPRRLRPPGVTSRVKGARVLPSAPGDGALSAGSGLKARARRGACQRDAPYGSQQCGRGIRKPAGVASSCRWRARPRRALVTVAHSREAGGLGASGQRCPNSSSIPARVPGRPAGPRRGRAFPSRPCTAPRAARPSRSRSRPSPSPAQARGRGPCSSKGR